MNNNYYREPDLIEMMVYILRKWRLLFVAGCISLVLCGAISYFSEVNSQNKRAEAIAAGELVKPTKEEEAYNKAKKERLDVETTIAKEKQSILEAELSIENSNITLKNKEEYAAKSIKMKINPLQVPRYVLQYKISVDTGDRDIGELYRDPVDSILRAYDTGVVYSECINALAEKYNTDKQYISELYSVYTDATSDLIVFMSNGVDLDQAEDIVRTLSEFFMSYKDTVTENYQEHTIMEVHSLTEEKEDTSLRDYQHEILAEIDSLKLQIQAKEQGVINSQNKIEQAELDLVLKQLAEDGALKNTEKNNTLKDAVKIGLIGAIIIVIGIAGCYCLKFVMGDVYIAKCQLPVCKEIELLAIAERTGKKGWFVDKLIDKMEGNLNEIPFDSAVELVAAIAANKGYHQSIAVLGENGCAELDAFADKLNKKLSNCKIEKITDIHKNAQMYTSMSNAECAVILIKRNETRKSCIAAQLAVLRSMKSNVLGIVMV